MSIETLLHDIIIFWFTFVPLILARVMYCIFYTQCKYFAVVVQIAASGTLIV